MPDFDSLWNWARSRGEFQQEYTELRHIFDLMSACDCKSYLEVGTAEGNSLYILGHAVDDRGTIDYIDLDENHTREARTQSIQKLVQEKWPMQGRMIGFHHGNSTDPLLLDSKRKFDCVLIDGGHDYKTVLSDSIMYAKMANKYVFWHDIQLLEVKIAVDCFLSAIKSGKYSTFINSDNFGYGILEIDQ